MKYVVTVGDKAGPFATVDCVSFDQALSQAAYYKERFPHATLLVHNSDRADYATDTGWYNGLTEDEQEQWDEAC